MEMMNYTTLDQNCTNEKASTSFLQRKLQIGYNRAARIIDQMEDNGIVSKANHVGKERFYSFLLKKNITIIFITIIFIGYFGSLKAIEKISIINNLILRNS